MSDRSRYERLKERAESPRSSDFGRAAIYLFDRYCRRCGVGMVRPRRNDRRVIRKLWSISFCSETCHENGKRKQIETSITVKSGASSQRNEYTTEEMAMLGVKLQRENNHRSPTARLVYEAETRYQLQSEKLRFLEVSTGEKWYPTKYYAWVEKL